MTAPDPAHLEELRTRVLEALDHAEAEGRLAPALADEHRSFARGVRAPALLEGLVASLRLELPPPGALPLRAEPGLPVPADAGTPVPTAPEEDEAPLRLSAFFGSEERAGPWTVPKHLELNVLLGSVELDLREAFVTADYLVVDYTMKLGSIEIIVPPGVEVRAEHENFMSSFGHTRKRNAEQLGEGFLLVVRGDAWLSSFEVVEKAVPTGEGALRRMARFLGRGERRPADG